MSTTARSHDLSREVLLVRTVPVRTMDDFSVYHYVLNERGNLSLRKGAPPKAVKAAAADLASGKATMGEFLDRIGVPK